LWESASVDGEAALHEARHVVVGEGESSNTVRRLLQNSCRRRRGEKKRKRRVGNILVGFVGVGHYR
jgi:hypothetical protein